MWTRVRPHASRHPSVQRDVGLRAHAAKSPFTRCLFGCVVATIRSNPGRLTKQGTLATVLVLLLTPHVCEALDREQLWTIDVSRLIGEPVNSDVSESVWGLAFSPDETQLAIGFGQHRTADSRAGRGHVVVVALEQPKTVLHRFNVAASPVFPLPGNLSWSPSGQLLAVDSRVFSLDGKLVCGYGDEFRFAGFLNEDRMVFHHWFSPTKGFEVRRSNCTKEDSWETTEFSESALATCPQGGLIAVGRFSAEAGKSFAIDIVTYPGHSTTRQWTWNADALLSGAVFADSCRVVCAGKLRSDSKGYSAACWNIESGDVSVDKASVTLTDRPSFDAVAEDWVASTVFAWSCLEGKFWVFLDMDGCVAKVKRRVVWNVRTGQESISWSPPEQEIDQPGSARKRVLESFAFTMSAHHRFIAEGGAGRVRVYRFH